ncbi:1-deoxy-D-xylulose-5-phosphate reductoisomerase [bacterium]|nr:1-deoxy-D-xylulose-5-phosphate reductoisomerase [bacterium]
MVKKISILGSTGSIGRQTLSVINENKKKFLVYSLSAGKNVKLLLNQVSKYRPKIISLSRQEDAMLIMKNPLLRNIKIVHGNDGLKEIGGKKESDILVAATSDVSSLIPTLEFLKNGKRVCIASKEIFLLLGKEIVKIAKKYSGEIIPIDSEHSGLFQIINNEPESNIKAIYLTASGGPFFGKKRKDLKDVTPEEALKHPTWTMGKKISIDSATMMNKAIEIIEASLMFNIPHQKIYPIINKKSHIHSIVEFIDGNILFSGSENDMKIPIGYSLDYPKRIQSKKRKIINYKNIELIKINEKNYSAFKLARKAMDLGGSMPAVMNAANGVAVESFLNRKLRFNDILKVVEQTMNEHKIVRKIDLKKIIKINEIAKKSAYTIVNK